MRALHVVWSDRAGADVVMTSISMTLMKLFVTTHECAVIIRRAGKPSFLRKKIFKFLKIFIVFFRGYEVTPVTPKHSTPCLKKLDLAIFWHNFAKTSRLWIIFGREDQEAITY